MPRWNPDQIWEGEDAYVIGGGDSLRKFDWDLLRDKNTIGCNSAYALGVDICKIVIFGDRDWWNEIGKKGTEEYGGLVVGCCPRLYDDPCPWLLTMQRHKAAGLGREGLAWHGNTGSAAMNLALVLGARRVFLLGYDMKLSPEGRTNFHDIRHLPDPKIPPYPVFLRQMIHIPKTLPVVFPGCEIWNVTNDSDMELFPKIGIEEHFSNEGKEYHVAS